MKQSFFSNPSLFIKFARYEKIPVPASFSFFIIAASFLLLFMSGTRELSGQSLAGKWRDLQYNVFMELSSQGTYAIQYPQGKSTGRFGVNGNVFWMQDFSGAPPVYYTIVQYTGNLLVLKDVNNLTLNYQRQTAQSQPAPTPLPSTSSSPARTLASKDGYTLTSHHIDTGIGLIQFIIGQAIKASEKEELEAQSIKEFNIDPSYFIKEIDSLTQSLQTIRSFTDPVRIGLTRQQLFAALYQATYQMNEADKPLMIQVMNRYIKVLAFDPSNSLVLTDKDTEGMMKYLAFNSELMGQPVILTDALKQSMFSEMVKNFYVMPLKQKQLLCSASLIWQLLEVNWNQLTPAQRDQFKSAFQTQIAQNYQPPNDSYTTPPANQNYSTADSMRDYRARQNMMSMMNQMNMDSHALSLNIIENIGGTGNYWSVVDY